jgi:hypothetical protein
MGLKFWVRKISQSGPNYPVLRYTKTPLKAKPIKARSHFEETYKSETSMEINFFSINTS